MQYQGGFLMTTDTDAGSVSNTSGGIDIAAQEVFVGGDVVGRDKISSIQSEYGSQISHGLERSVVNLHGLGVWIVDIANCEDGAPMRVVERALDTSLSHLIIKIADGPKPYPDKASDDSRLLTAIGRRRDMQIWGWQRLLGINPDGELEAARQQIKAYDLDGYVASVGNEFIQVKADAVRDWFNQLRESSPSLPIGLSAQQYPSYQPDMPWRALLESVDFVAPQVYWESAHNPGAQLLRSLEEYRSLAPELPVFPIGSTYSTPDWKPTPSDLIEFLTAAAKAGVDGVSLYHWDWLGKPEQKELWSILARMPWDKLVAQSRPSEPPPTTPPEPELSAESKQAPLQPPIPEPTFERRFIQIIRNDEVDRIEDRLGFDTYADTFVNLVLDERTRPPLTIGISGAWGSGKSFILHRIEQKLTDIIKQEAGPPPKWYQFAQRQHKPRLHVVHFNAWDYNAAEAVWPGLVRGILDKLESGTGSLARSLIRARRNFSREIGSVRNRLIPSLILLLATLIVVGYVTQGNLALLTVLGLGGIYGIFKLVLDLPVAQWITDLFAKGRNYGSALGYMDEIRNDIKALKKQLPANAKITVIIDDLDRCNAEKIVDTLEAVKLLLNFDIFIVFLAIDSNVIARAIETRYKEILAEAGRSGYLYLDKIVQIPFRIPLPESTTTNKYLSSLLAAVDRPPTQALPDKKVTDIARQLSSLAGAPISTRFLATLPDEPSTGEAIVRDATAGMFKPGTLVSQLEVIWALLAHWWPVSSYLMHDLLRGSPAQTLKSDPAQPFWIPLADLVDQRTANDLPAQRLREVVDAPLPMFRSALQALQVEAAYSVDDLTALLVRWKAAYPITIGFTPAEIETFQNLSVYFVRNPRHIKRLVNTYSVIRMLAARTPNGQVVLNAPEAMLKWLLITSQWPLMAQTMLQIFDDELEARSSTDPLPKDDDALGRLYRKANEKIEAEPKAVAQRDRLDGDAGVLNNLIRSSFRVLTSEQLNILRAYSITFNPAEGNLIALAAEKVSEKTANGEKTE
jgi:hypothetical protein